MTSEPTNERVMIGSWESYKYVALPLRVEVFVQEQGVPAELEHDEFDEAATHAVVLDSTGHAVATGRLLLTGQGMAKIGRLAVTKSCRGQGLGKLVLVSLVEHAEIAGISSVKLHAQCDAEQFYQRLGFETQGEPFMEAGIKHVLMVRQLTV